MEITKEQGLKLLGLLQHFDKTGETVGSPRREDLIGTVYDTLVGKGRKSVMGWFYWSRFEDLNGLPAGCMSRLNHKSLYVEGEYFSDFTIANWVFPINSLEELL